MEVVIEPKARRSVWLFLPFVILLPLLVWSSFKTGPFVLVTSAIAMGGAVFLLARFGRIDRKGFRIPPSPNADLAAIAVMKRTAGQVELGSGVLTWKPWPKMRGRARTRMSIPFSNINRVVLQAQPSGMTRGSYRVRCEVVDGAPVEMLVLGKLDDFSQALRAS
jgi:hypothetical protein